MKARHLLHRDGALHPHCIPQAPDRIPKAEGVDDPSPASHVVAGDPLDAVAADVGTPNDVAAPDHDGELHAPGHHPLDLLSDPPEGLHVDAVRLAADQRLTDS